MTDLSHSQALSILDSLIKPGSTCEQPDRFIPSQIILALNRLTNGQKFILIEHALGLRPVLVSEAPTVVAMIDRGLLRYVSRSNRPSHTEATDEGRAVIARLLARWADRLVAKLEDGA